MNTLKKGLSEKNVAWMMAVLLALSILPLLILSFYSGPAMDDYMFSAPCAAVAKDGFFAALRAALTATAGYYNSWQGTFTAIPLFCLQPGIWGTGFYALTTWIMLAALCGGTFRICSVLLGDYARAGSVAVAITACCVLIPVIQFFPSVYEALYWFNGSSYYLLFQGLMLFWLSDILLFLKDGKILRLIPATVYAFLISGGNYVTALLTMELGVLTLLYAFFAKKKRRGYLFFPFAVLCMGFAANAVAPGNAVRAGGAYSLSDAIRSILTSVGTAGKSFGEYTSIYVLLLCAVLIPVFIKAAGNTDFRFPYPLAVLAVAFLFYASSFTPTAFALGLAEGPHRLRNMRYWLFVLLLFFCLFYTVGWICRQLKARGTYTPMLACVKELWHSYGPVTLAAIGALFCVCLALSPNKSETATLGALKSLVSGEAATWKKENLEHEQILLSDETDPVLPAHTVRPKLLTSYDEDGNMNDSWSVNKIAVYYGKNSVRIQQE